MLKDQNVFRAHRKAMLLALIVVIFSSVSRSYQTHSFLSRYKMNGIDRHALSEQRSRSTRINAYADIEELNEAIRKDSSKAFELLTEQQGKINMETVHLTLNALSVKGTYRLSINPCQGWAHFNLAVD